MIPSAIRYSLILFAWFAALASSAFTVRLEVAHPGHAVPKTLYGVFFEDINSSADGGLYPERIANRGFDWATGDLAAWRPDNRGDAMARLTRQYGNPVHEATAAHLRIECWGPGQGCGIRNDGFDGIAVAAGEKFNLSFYARGLDGYAGSLRVLLEDAEGGLLAAYAVPSLPPSPPPRVQPWSRFTTVLVPSATVRDAHLSILLDAPGTVELEQVSLFPQDTFNGRPNGLRRDLVKLLKDLAPGILRFPGGCVTEGHDWNQWYDWKRSVGDGSLESRPAIPNYGGLWQTRGLGFYEYFCPSEDIGAEPVPVLGAGVICQNVRPYVLAPMSSMGYFASNACDLIEFANGATSTPWGALRAKMGHPQPFNLKYLGIGNENWMEPFLERYLAIAKLVKARHPEIRLISSAGPWPEGKEYELAWKTLNPANADIVDEHIYKDPDWLLANATRYDRYDRHGSKVYIGELACFCDKRANNLRGALCEAAFMTGVERNSDVVEMLSYAPLFAKVGHVGWHPDLIWFDNVGAYVTPNYYVQKLFSRNRPTRVVPLHAELGAPELRSLDAFCSAGLDDVSGELILKFVNVSANAIPVTFDFGLALPAQSVRRDTLAGEPLAHNDFRHPQAVAPVSDVCSFPGGNEWKGESPAYSLAVFRFKLP